MADADPPKEHSQKKSPVSGLYGLDPGELLARALDSVKPSAGASAWEPPAPEVLGRLLPGYRIEKLIGRGGMGAVYKGVQLNLDRPVAIKLLPAEIAADAEFVNRFKREARTLARLQHSRIVTIHDFGQTTEGHLYFVMEYIDGTDLRRILNGPGLDPEQALAVVGQLCDALQAAHHEGIVHRDIKPENVLVTKDGYVKLADFGLSRPSKEEGTPNLTETNVIMGTASYMAPEQQDSAIKADHRSDIFALGVMLYEMLTGRTPQGVFDPPSHKLRVDVRIDEVVLKALQSEPERRYQKASEMKTDVDRIRTTPLPSAPPPASPPRRGETLVLAGGVLLLLAAAAFFFFRPKEAPLPAAPVEIVAVATPAPVLQSPPATPPAVAVTLPVAASAPASGDAAGVKATPEPIDPARAAIANRVWMMSVGLPPAKPSAVGSPTPVPITPAAAVTPKPVPPDPAPPPLQILVRQAPNLRAWVLAPLDESVPGDLRQNLTFLREDLADEAPRQPIASVAAYQAGYRLCNVLLGALDEREQTRVRAGYRAAQADTTTGISTDQTLSARRNYMMRMPQYRREQAQREELKSEALNSAELLKQGPKLEWANRTDVLGSTIDNLYAQFRAALRQGTK